MAKSRRPNTENQKLNTDSQRPTTNDRKPMGTRRKSRELAVQMLFQSDMGKQDAEQVRKTFWSERRRRPAASPGSSVAAAASTSRCSTSGPIARRTSPPTSRGL